MSSFRKPKKILREAVGSYVNGVWVPGARSVFTVQASVQPIRDTDGKQDIEPMPDGRHLADYFKVYSSTKLQVTADGENVQPDIIVQDGYGHEIMSIGKFQSDVISHYKYIAVKIFKYTSDADWLSGATVRP